jgi:hypothetical protein
MGAEASVPMEVNEADVSWVAAPGGKSGVGVVRWRSKVLHASPFLRAPHPARAAHLLRQWRYAQHPAVLKSLNITPYIIINLIIIIIIMLCYLMCNT